jgi:hypothetical protein
MSRELTLSQPRPIRTPIFDGRFRNVRIIALGTAASIGLTFIPATVWAEGRPGQNAGQDARAAAAQAANQAREEAARRVEDARTRANQRPAAQSQPAALNIPRTPSAPSAPASPDALRNPSAPTVPVAPASLAIEANASTQPPTKIAAPAANPAISEASTNHVNPKATVGPKPEPVIQDCPNGKTAEETRLQIIERWINEGKITGFPSAQVADHEMSDIVFQSRFDIDAELNCLVQAQAKARASMPNIQDPGAPRIEVVDPDPSGTANTDQGIDEGTNDGMEVDDGMMGDGDTDATAEGQVVQLPLLAPLAETPDPDVKPDVAASGAGIQPDFVDPNAGSSAAPADDAGQDGQIGGAESATASLTDSPIANTASESDVTAKSTAQATVTSVKSSPTTLSVVADATPYAPKSTIVTKDGKPLPTAQALSTTVPAFAASVHSEGDALGETASNTLPMLPFEIGGGALLVISGYAIGRRQRKW